MATFQTRNGRTTATVRKQGRKSISRTFDTRALAEHWAREVERSVDLGSLVDHAELRSTTVGDLLRRFDREVVPHRKGWRWEANRIKNYLLEPWALLALDKDIPEALRQWRDLRLRQVAPQTVNRDFNLLGSVFTHARKEWGIVLDNPVHQVKRPKAPSGARDVTWTDEELELFLDHLKFDSAVAPLTSTAYVGWVLKLARLLGLRRGSLCATKLAWIDMPNRCIHYPAGVVKNGEAYDCPVSKAAGEVLEALVAHRIGQERLIEPSADTITTLFARVREVIAKDHPQVKRLTLHDQRHTWTTRVIESGLAKGRPIDQITLLKMSGRKSVKELARYYNPKASDLADLMD